MCAAVCFAFMCFYLSLFCICVHVAICVLHVCSILFCICECAAVSVLHVSSHYSFAFVCGVVCSWICLCSSLWLHLCVCIRGICVFYNRLYWLCVYIPLCFEFVYAAVFVLLFCLTFSFVWAGVCGLRLYAAIRICMICECPAVCFAFMCGCMFCILCMYNHPCLHLCMCTSSVFSMCSCLLFAFVCSSSVVCICVCAAICGLHVSVVNICVQDLSVCICVHLCTAVCFAFV